MREQPGVRVVRLPGIAQQVKWLKLLAFARQRRATLAAEHAAATQPTKETRTGAVRRQEKS